MSDKSENLIGHLYKSDRDADGAINCGEEDYHYIQAYNDGLRDARKVMQKKIDELEKYSSFWGRICARLQEKLQTAEEEIKILREALEQINRLFVIGEATSCHDVEKLIQETLIKALEKIENMEGGMSDKSCMVAVLITKLPHFDDDSGLEEALSQIECALDGHEWEFNIGLVEEE